MPESCHNISDDDDDESVISPLCGGDEHIVLHSMDDRFKFLSCRHILAFMAFLGFFNVYCLRVNLSVALVEMVNSSYSERTYDNDSECLHQVSNSTDKREHTGEFNWDANVQGLILGSFFYGYITTQIPGGWLAEKFGGKWLYGLGILCTAILTLLTPIAARTHVYLLLAVRILEGIGEGVTFPAMHAILSNWAPPLERSKLGTFIYAGAQMGTVVSMPVSGLLCKYGFADGWPSVFYVFGSLGCLWFVGWCFLCYDSPAKHPRISYSERQYLETVIHKPDKKPPTPWFSILTSARVWAIVAAHFTNNWGYYTLLTCLPSYMKQVLHFDISQNGMLSGLPYLFTWITMTAGGQIADVLRKRRLLSTTWVRKLFNTIGQILPAIFLVITGYLGCDPVLAVVMITVAVGASGFTMSGYGVNHLDIAPPFAGTLMGLTNAVATIPGFLGPQVVGALTKDNASRGQWQIVFFIAAAIYVLGSLLFLVLASGEEQIWAHSGVRSITKYSSSSETGQMFEEDRHLPDDNVAVYQ
ncbi:hypothetical protein LSH36_660g02057 [Paralvinella palmiformis]|uniref:Sialin n=1 Tax=Paralvinella palmiformis TaxID=53620 RepID=A0AAD9MWM3_9ANNE|nr:hypothetical protein LSH36_660g02057 [Paralvinella palmiformis]